MTVCQGPECVGEALRDVQTRAKVLPPAVNGEPVAVPGV